MNARPRRTCVECGRLFPIPLKSTGPGKPKQYSKRKTCGKRCQYSASGTGVEQSHQRRRTADPEGYRETQMRDYSAMGRMGGKASRGTTGHKYTREQVRYMQQRKAEEREKREHQKAVDTGC